MTEEEFMKMAKAKYANIHALNDQPTLLDYEQGLVEIMQELGREIAQAQLGESTKDRRKKSDIDPPSAQLK